MSVIGSNILAGASGQAGYNLTKSLRFRSSASAYLNRTPASASNRRTFTYSGWLKRGLLDTTYNKYFFSAKPSVSVRDGFYFGTNQTLSVFANDGSSALLVTSQVFRDVSAWYHIVVAVDTTQATASNRIKLYVNGVQVTAFGTATYPSQNYDWAFNNTVIHTISDDAANVPSGLYHYDGYMAEINFIDGQALTPSSFGETSTSTGVWIPKKYTGTYGTNGFYLPFTDTTSTTTISEDFSGNNNDWTSNNISLTAGATYDSMTDVPTLTSATTANYCTWNPLINGDSATNGNLDVTNDTARGTQELLKYDAYWEITSTGGTTTAGVVSGTGTTNTTTVADTKTYGFRLTTTGTLDYINITDGGSFTNITTGLTAQQFSYASAASATTGSFNAGQRPFAATPPTGFVALNTFNLPTPTIGATASSQANKYMDVTLWTGDGTTNTRSFTNSGSMQPDWIWTKARSATWAHNIFDSVRGFANDKGLNSNLTDAEGTNRNGYVSAANSNGFSMANGTSGNQYYNENGTTYVGWQWRASNATAVTNTAGSITSTVSANTSAGFSIVTYTGTGSNATVGHGLGVVPRMIIVKERSVAARWDVYHASVGATGRLILNDTTGTETTTAPWNDTAPTSSVFTVGIASETNDSGQTFVAYCFAPIAGYSAFGSYTGNGSTDGTFVYTGFRPRFVMVKESSASGNNWVIYDTARDTYNECSKILYPNASNAEFDGSTVNLDILSNGFKPRDNWGGNNNSGNTYIYMAFAEVPYKFSNAR